MPDAPPPRGNPGSAAETRRRGARLHLGAPGADARRGLGGLGPGGAPPGPWPLRRADGPWPPPRTARAGPGCRLVSQTVPLCPPYLGSRPLMQGHHGASDGGLRTPRNCPAGPLYGSPRDLEEDKVSPPRPASRGSSTQLHYPLSICLTRRPASPRPGRAHPLLLHRVALADRDGVVLEGVEVDGDAVRRADLVLAAVAAADRAGVVELDVPAAAAARRRGPWPSATGRRCGTAAAPRP